MTKVTKDTTNGAAPTERVWLLADEPKDTPYMKEVIEMSAVLLRAAREDRLVSIVCGHDDSDKKSVVLCAMFPSPDGQHASYAPIAQLFDSNWNSWTKLTPPKAAMALPNEP